MKKPLFYFFLLVSLWGCSTTDPISEFAEQPIPEEETPQPSGTGDDTSKTYNYLALGDSYTIGESVCNTCKFPIQLKTAFEAETTHNLETKVIARTGWRTDNLINAVNQENLDSKYDLITLLIGVNNQFQGGNLEVYKNQFEELLETAIDLAKQDKNRVVVLSIPDYAYTPFGQSTSSPEKISSEIDQFNEAAKQITENSDIRFLNITDITRRGLDDSELVASDGLHPSEKAYALFVERLFLIVTAILKNN